MQIREGWSGEYAPNQWGKVDVYLDEVDLQRMLVEAQINTPPDAITVHNVFQLLSLEAQRLVLASLMTNGAVPVEDGTPRLGRFAEGIAAVLNQIRRG